jgi:hypothetical protein
MVLQFCLRGIPVKARMPFFQGNPKNTEVLLELLDSVQLEPVLRFFSGS